MSALDDVFVLIAALIEECCWWAFICRDALDAMELMVGLFSRRIFSDNETGCE
jgi:hypothetical protein